jgi:uncharacterized protein (DUF1800 family)
MASLLPITGTLGKDRAVHLLRRVTFGPTIDLVNRISTMTINQATNQLLVADPPTGQPQDEAPPVGQTANVMDWPEYDNPSNMLRVWAYWFDKMRNDDTAFYKTTLFWHNHFAISMYSGRRYIRGFKYYRLLQTYALGNFKELVVAMTKDPLMLEWLDGQDNYKSRNGDPSNENYARELQELFTIGVATPAGTTNYTEEDVKAAARVLTGWQIANPTGSINSLKSVFTLSRHDTGDKTFSAKYGNKTIKGRSDANAGDTELRELVTMILAQQEAAKFICRKLYQWFVAADISAEIERDIIGPLATTFRTGNYEIKPVLKQLLSSEHFFSVAVRGAIIKNPLDHLFNMARLSDLEMPPSTAISTGRSEFNAAMNDFFIAYAQNLQMDLINHSTVFGWEGYYSNNGYKAWVSGSSIKLRGNAVDIYLKGYKTRYHRQVQIDVLTFIERILADAGYVFDNTKTEVKQLTTKDLSLASTIIKAVWFYSCPDPLKDPNLMSLLNDTLFDGDVQEIGFWFEWKAYKGGKGSNVSAMRNKLSNMLGTVWKSASFYLN